MASQSDNHIELDFTGQSAEEAEDFIRAVNRHAFATGMQRDSAWIAEFAYQSFSRKALRWYETLDEETQTDWKLLKRAILAEFTAGQPAPATVPSAAPVLVSPTPAAPPPPAVAVTIGRIRVDFEDHTKGGYFWIATNGLGTVVADSSKANIFTVDTFGSDSQVSGEWRHLSYSGIFKLFLKSSDERVSLNKIGIGNTPRMSQFPSYGCLMKSSAGSVTQWNHTWSIAEDGNIKATLLRTDGSQYDANLLVPSSFLNQVFHVPADKEAFLRQYGSGWTRFTLRLVPLS